LLPFALEEVETIGAILATPVHSEESATRTVLSTTGRRAGLIHIAAHGSFRGDAPLFSHIDLADGPLTTADVFSLELNAGLVVLSACETGRTVVGGGDELTGITRAFLYAGAAGLLVSQWRVEDASTAGLMTRFYREVAQGTGTASALRTAQAASAADGTHPYFWAAFQLIGDDQVMKL
jgi:CHAT domain-containing protein